MRPWWIKYGAGTAAILMASLGAEAARYLLGNVNISLIFLIVVVAMAIVWGLWLAIYTSFLAIMALDLLFIPPYGTVTVENPDDWLTFLFFLVIAIVTERLASGVRARAADAQRREQATAMLHDLSTVLITANDLPSIFPVIARHMAQTFALDACHVLLLDRQSQMHVTAGIGVWSAAEDYDTHGTVSQVLHSGQVARVVEPSHITADDTAATVQVTSLYLPLAVADSVVGVMRVARTGRAATFLKEEEQLLITFAYQASLAIDNMHLAEQARHAATLEEADRIKTALLSSVSHDLRSPLAAIKTAVTGLIEPGMGLDAQGQADLLGAIDTETDRLTRLVANLLDLSRIQSGAMHPQTEWFDITEIVTAIADRLSPRAGTRRIRPELALDLPLIHADYQRIDQVITNLIENGIAYSPNDTDVTITVRRDGQGILIKVFNEGPGIPPTDRERIFEPFFRGEMFAERQGSGLGLSICHGIITAHGGWIRIEESMGTTVAFWLPENTTGAALEQEAS